jgi:endogenous inhibitor of DNA gyrase (YacG/DUF329 family)
MSKQCPICGRPPVADFKPFCSRRCKTVDLNRWLSEGYRIPVADDWDEDPEAPPPSQRPN